MTDQECVALLRWATDRLGLRWEGFRGVRGQVCKRLSRRAKELGLDATAYRARLEADAEELERFDSFCRISISRFYRDRGVFDALREKWLPEASRGVESLRAWSAGCASGEEPYTLALLFHFSGGVKAEIVATDADEGLLERAHRACYPRATLRELPKPWIEEAFDLKDESMCLRPSFRENVRLDRQDLRQEMPAGPFELILCRNLAFTYFGPELQRETLSRLLDRLTPAGLLVLGAHEHLPEVAKDFLEPAYGALPIFRRIRPEPRNPAAVMA